MVGLKCWSIFEHRAAIGGYIMNNEQTRRGLAQPADEELKKHGDPLKKQVKDAAGKPVPDQDEERDKKTQDE
jgi:hypothetical protein